MDDIPIAVVTAGRSFEAFAGLGFPLRESDAVWMRLQRGLLELSSDSRHYVSPDATHEIYRDDPDLIVEAVVDLIERSAVRGTRLTQAGGSPSS